MMDNSQEETTEEQEFIPRPYQIDLYEQALTGNSIIYLPTGSGKTYIVVMVIKKLSADIRKPWTQDGKRTIFLVNTVPLVAQQCAYISRHSDLTCNGYSGDMNVDTWDKEMWVQEFKDNQVLVMTSQILLDILSHGFITLANINLIVFDECHHAVKDHPMRAIMKRFEDFSPSEQPKVLGTSATLLNSNIKIENVTKIIRELEITFHAKIITVDSISSVMSYGKPTEYVEYFNMADESSINEQITYCIDHVIEVLQTVKLSPLNPYQESCKVFQPRSKNVKLKCIFEDIRENCKLQGLYFTNIATLLYMAKFETLKRSMEHLQSIIIMDFVITQLILMRKIIMQEMQGLSELENMNLYSSDQLHKLFDIIYKVYWHNRPENHKFCCIIFVRRRSTAKILYHMLKLRAKHDSKFGFLVPEYVVGNSVGSFKSIHESMCVQKWNQEALAKFRAGSVNCLVATDVLDEGIDIPLCSLVIRYDIPQDFRAYVQSKGRGRHKQSQYVILSTNSPVFLGKYSTYRKVEDMLSRYLMGNANNHRYNPLPKELEECLYTSQIEPFNVLTSTGATAVITELSAISVINHYCSKLCNTKFVHCVPIWNLYSGIVTGTNDKYYIVTLQLPISSALREKIHGDKMSSIGLAKRSAALYACRRLYEIGELNENLLPRNIDEIVADITLLLPNWQDEDDDNKKIVGTTSCKRPHDIIYPEALHGAFPVPKQDCYVHIISTKPSYPIPIENRNRVFYNFLSDSAGFAILSSKMMPTIPNFPVYMNVGSLETTLNVNFAKVNLSSDEIMELRRFHWVIFTEVLELVKSFMSYDSSNNENSFLIVPVDHKWNIDWDVVRRYPSIRQETAQNHSLRAITNGLNSEPIMDECGWQLVTPNYRTSIGMYVVTQICHELTPKSAFPTEDYLTYIHYFRSRHRLNITDEHQPLLEVKPISKKINCIRMRDYEKTSIKRKRSDLEEHLVPELCCKVMFPALYWLKATLLPSILHRVSQLLIADDLRRDIARNTGLGVDTMPTKTEWPPLILKSNDNDENSDSFLQMETNVDESNSLDNNKLDMPATPEIDVLSLESTRYPWSKNEEPCDIVRNIETVQQIDIDYYHKWTDSFSNMNEKLKFTEFHKRFYAKRSDVPIPSLMVLNRTVSSIGPSPADIMPALTPKLANDAFNLERLETLGDSYLKFIISIYLFENFPTYDEGALTSAKGTIIGNRYLYYCAKKKNIPGRLKVDEFEPSSNFIVPSYCTPRKLQLAVRIQNKLPNVLYEIKIPQNEQFEGELSLTSESAFYDKINSWVDAKNATGVEPFVGFQFIADKTISDSVEALIGVYLNSMGLIGAARLLKWFGIIPNDVSINKILNGLISTARIGNGDIDSHIPWVNNIENALNYKFSDRSFILQAFTHPSYSANTITSSYNRLEFLGDAVIDFLITIYIYENCGDLTPGALTDLRSALVNNITFACLTVKYGLHTAILAHAPLLSDIIERFVKYQEDRNHVINDELLWILLEEDECNMAEYVDVPKVLGDLFESVIGAIYLDSGKNLSKVWEIIYGLMHNEIHSFSKNVPKQPVRVIYETQGAHPKFLKSESVEGTNSIMIPLEVQISGKKKIFHGFGSTKKQAKAAAAKLALKTLRKNL